MVSVSGFKTSRAGTLAAKVLTKREPYFFFCLEGVGVGAWLDISK